MSATFAMLTRQGYRALVLAPRHAIKYFCVLEADRQPFVQPWGWLVFILMAITTRNILMAKTTRFFLPKEQALACWGVLFINYHCAFLWLKRCDFNRIVLAFEGLFCKSPKA
jgi:hypothetical protein